MASKTGSGVFYMQTSLIRPTMPVEMYDLLYVRRLVERSTAFIAADQLNTSRQQTVQRRKRNMRLPEFKMADCDPELELLNEKS